VWNTPYVIDVNNLDSYPLMNPWAPSGFNGTVYIRADGSIDPPEAPIATSDNVTYILTGKISSEENGIVVERDSILIDGNGYTIGGAGANNAAGIDLSGRENVTIQNTQIQDFYTGVLLNSSSNNHVSGNNITANSNYGIYLVSSPNNSISGNNITNTLDGISLAYSSYNIIAGNNITATDSDGIELAYASNYNFISRNTMTANNWNGIELSDSSNNSIVGNNFDDSSYCVELWSSHNNSIAGNNITNNYCGMILYSGYNDISGNNITNNDCGIFLCYPPSSENRIYHNNFVSNTVQVYSDASVNVFDDSYPSGGNYWSDYDGSDVYCGAFQNVTGSDGIGDAAYTIDASNVDHYPLASQSTMSNFTVILAGIGPVNVGFMSNSTVGNVQIDEAARSLSFNVSGPTGTSGFCRIVLPNIVVESLWGGNYTVLLNGELCSFTSASDSENTYIFISYTHSEHQVVIIPEFPSFLVLALITAAILAAKIYKRRKAAGPDEDVSSLHWLEVEV
jgi:parallel beta-helix repeat protein